MVVISVVDLPCENAAYSLDVYIIISGNRGVLKNKNDIFKIIHFINFL